MKRKLLSLCLALLLLTGLTAPAHAAGGVPKSDDALTLTGAAELVMQTENTYPSKQVGLVSCELRLVDGVRVWAVTTAQSVTTSYRHDSGKKDEFIQFFYTEYCIGAADKKLYRVLNYTLEGRAIDYPADIAPGLSVSAAVRTARDAVGGGDPVGYTVLADLDGRNVSRVQLLKDGELHTVVVNDSQLAVQQMKHAVTADESGAGFSHIQTGRGEMTRADAWEIAKKKIITLDEPVADYGRYTFWGGERVWEFRGIVIDGRQELTVSEMAVMADGSVIHYRQMTGWQSNYKGTRVYGG